MTDFICVFYQPKIGWIIFSHHSKFLLLRIFYNGANIAWFLTGVNMATDKLNYDGAYTIFHLAICLLQTSR